MTFPPPSPIWQARSPTLSMASNSKWMAAPTSPSIERALRFGKERPDSTDGPPVTWVYSEIVREGVVGRNVETLHRMFDAIAAKDLAAFRTLCADDYRLWHSF